MSETAENNGASTVVEAPEDNREGKDPNTGRFLPGNTYGRGNKGSRWLSKKLEEAIDKVVTGSDDNAQTYYKALIEKVLDKAINDGDIKAIELIWNRLEGKPQQRIDFSGDVRLAPLSEEKKAELLNLLSDGDTTGT